MDNCGYSTAFSNSWSCTCAEGQYYSGLIFCFSCNSLCDSCISANVSECYTCKSGAAFNGPSCSSCLGNCDTCSSPSFCTQCSAGFYLYSDGTCKSTCPTPFTSSATPVLTCNTPCSAANFLYWDSTCLASCPSIYTSQTITTGYKLCKFPCSAGQNLFSNGTCITNSLCVYPLSYSIYKTKDQCDYPCTGAQ
jgi:hypothetical protein